MASSDEPGSGYRLRGDLRGALIAWCVIGLLVLAIGVTVIQ
jgi:hypothetical protein